MRILTIIFLIFVHNLACAEIIQTSDYAIIAKKIKESDKRTVIMFDLDDVITIPEDEYNITFPERKQHMKYLEKRYNELEIKNFHSIILKDRRIKLVDQKIPEIFDYIEKNNIKAMAVTKCFTHKYGKLDDAHNWRIKELQSIGIDFSKTSPLKGTYKIKDITPINGRPSSIPMYQDGIVFTARADKGMILERIFAHFKYYPKRILFIDDKFKNLASIEKLSKKYNIKFDGIIINKSHKMQRPKLDSRKEAIRFKILEEEGKWIID